MRLFAEPEKKEKRRHFKEAFGSEELYDEAFTLRTVYAKEWIDKNGLPVKKGLVELLEYLKKENIPAALATSTNRKKAMGYLDMANVTEYFSASVCGDEVKAAKPAGDIFILRQRRWEFRLRNVLFWKTAQMV